MRSDITGGRDNYFVESLDRGRVENFYGFAAPWKLELVLACHIQ